MYDRVLKQMRASVRSRLYVMTLHGEEEMDNDALSVFDVERAILTGEIVERQKEHTTAEYKYLIKGHTDAGAPIIAVTKLSPTGKLVIITVYRP